MYSMLIDTHSRNVTIVIYKDSKILKSVTENNLQTSEIIMPMIKKIFLELKINKTDLKEIIVVNGPGSFTGCRIGVVIAKVYAYSLNIPVKVLNSLELVLYSNEYEQIVVSVSENNGKFVASYKNNNLQGEISYLNNEEYDNYKLNNKIVEEKSINYEKVYEKVNKYKEYVNPHFVNPLYIKKIEVSKL